MCGLTMRIAAMPTLSPPAVPSSIFQRLGTRSRPGALVPSGAMPGIGGMVSSGAVSAASMASLSLICRPPAGEARGEASFADERQMQARELLAQHRQGVDELVLALARHQASEADDELAVDAAVSYTHLRAHETDSYL